MRRVSVSLNDTLADALETYVEQRPDTPAASDILRAALGEYLAARGYVQASQQPERRKTRGEDISQTVSHEAGQDHTMETLEAYIVALSAVPPTPPSVLNVLRRYLGTMGVSVPQGPLRTPQFRTIEDESGHSDTSVEHDRVLAELRQ
jgi:Arc/MetJ-type ribon-helix-helix transcriptional regulator